MPRDPAEFKNSKFKVIKLGGQHFLTCWRLLRAGVANSGEVAGHKPYVVKYLIDSSEQLQFYNYLIRL